MPASPLDSALYAHLFGDPETASFFTDKAELGAMLRVEAALASVQGALGLIPSEAAAAIAAAARQASIRPADLAVRVAADGVPVPALVATLRQRVGTEHGSWVHWGATSQDIMDTGLSLRLRGVLNAWHGPLAVLLSSLGAMAAAHAETPMAARTYGQAAVPTSFGAVVACWGRPLLRHRDRLAGLAADRPVSLSGAAGTLAAMGARGPEVRAALARELGLCDPGASWHAERAPVGDLAAALAALLGTLGKMGEDLLLLAQSGVEEVRVAGGGASSTMPQKENPVGPAVLVAAARTGLGLAGVVQSAALHRQQRDGAAWFAEWLALPQLCILVGRGLVLAADLAARLSPDPSAMARNLDAGGGAVHAEALSFALAGRMPRPAAQAEVKRLVLKARATGTSVPELARRDHPGLDWPGPDLGQAPAEARAFAAACSKIATVAQDACRHRPPPDAG